MKHFSFLLMALAIGFGGHAQQTIPLDNLDEFKPQAGNWTIVGKVTMPREIQPEAQETGKKRKKKSKSSPEHPNANIQTQQGTGILINQNNEEQRDALITQWEHGDIHLEFDVMLPPGSNSGVFLQGRYEIQLFDSWGVKNPKYSDMGGIYRNWETEPEKALQGIPPRVNAAKAPGLWQHMEIDFQAPRFDDSGNKINNATFERVILNGEIIHQYVEVPLPCGAPIENNEVPLGPLMIQGDHGPVAFKNIQYTLLEPSRVDMSALNYQVYQGAFNSLSDLDDQKPIRSGKSRDIDVSLSGLDNEYAIAFSGNLIIPEKDEYQITVGYTGGFRLELDGKTIDEVNAIDAGGKASTSILLDEGEHTFRLTNIKSAGWRPARLALSLKTNSTNTKDLHNYNSYPELMNTPSSILINPGKSPRMLRGFVAFDSRNPKITHSMGVGHTEGVNYIINLKTGGLVGMWRGNFADATPMWHDRGNGSFNPNGAVVWTFLDQPLAVLSSDEAPFPSEFNHSNFTSSNYQIDSDSGMPLYNYTLEGVEITSQIQPDADYKYWTQSMRFSKQGLQNWYYKLAEGPTEKLADGSYLILEGQYYVRVLSGASPVERTVNGKKELILPIDGSDVKFEIIW